MYSRPSRSPASQLVKTGLEKIDQFQTYVEINYTFQFSQCYTLDVYPGPELAMMWTKVLKKKIYVFRKTNLNKHPIWSTPMSEKYSVLEF